jgi:ABC-2 type transport system ATP-binding protein
MDAPPIPAVAILGLTRLYGNITALNNLDLTVNQGDLFGFIGSNGAGKTTTLRILATFLAPSAGTAKILGWDVVREADAVRHVIGYMPDFFGVYKDMEVTEYLDFFGACYKIPTAQREKTVADVLELVGLTEKRGAIIGALSRGMQQRVDSRPETSPAGRTGQRPGPARAHRDDGHSPGTPAPGQDHHYFLPHLERAANPLQPGGHH